MLAKVLSLIPLLLTLSLLPPTFAQAQGNFQGAVVVEWLDDGRKMKLVRPFGYIDPSGALWDAPVGWVIDGASIPKPAWSFIGGPFEGKYRRASVIHDVACDQKLRPWQDVHKAFYYAMLAAQVEELTAKIMYAAVYHGGPRWDRQQRLSEIPVALASRIAENLRTAASAGEQVEVKVSPIPRYGCPAGQVCITDKELPPIAADITATYRALPPMLSDQDMDRLKDFIRSSSPTLSEIEQFR